MVSPFPISIPLLLNSEELRNNRTQQSLRFSKPLNVEYVKESTEHILKEKHDIDGKIDKLEILTAFLSNNKKIQIKFIYDVN